MHCCNFFLQMSPQLMHAFFGAEADQLEVFQHNSGMSGFHIKCFASSEYFGAFIFINNLYGTLYDIAPMRHLAMIILQSLKQGGEIRTCRSIIYIHGHTSPAVNHWQYLIFWEIIKIHVGFLRNFVGV